MKPTVKAEKIRMLKSEKGIVLAAVVVFTFILTILGFSVLIVANSEVASAQRDIDRTKAFYLAEAGVEVFTAKLSNGEFTGIGETSLGEGSYRVDFNSAVYPPYAIATGVVGGQQRRIKVTASFLAPPYECGIYAGGAGGMDWTLMLRGNGSPAPKFDGGESGGADAINGNIFVDGDVRMYQQSNVNPPLGINPFNLKGDVDATGIIVLNDTATVAGTRTPGAEPYGLPDLVGMKYAINNTHNVSQIFEDTDTQHNSLPEDNELYDVFVINPDDRYGEYTSTDGNDYFLELHTDSPDFIEGDGWKTAETPLDVGNGSVYYINGNLWVNSKYDTYGFNMHGRATIVVTGNIYICDNLKYADTSSMLGLVALGNYDDDGQLVSGGNVIFGDPDFGTMYTFSAMMFAADSFLFNTRSIGSFSEEPESGFTIDGSLAALNQVSIERDWYSVTPGYYWSTKRPARYDPATDKWYDSGTGDELTPAQSGSIKHYQMVINYDDRVRSQGTQPPGLPKGTGLIFEGLTGWEELP